MAALARNREFSVSSTGSSVVTSSESEGYARSDSIIHKEQSIQINNECKSENAIQKSNVMIGSTIHVPQENAEVNIIHNYYNGTTPRNDENEENTPLLKTQVDRKFSGFKNWIIWALVALIVILVVFYVYSKPITVPKKSKAHITLRKDWKKDSNQSLPDKYLRKTTLPYTDIKLSITCSDTCNTQKACRDIVRAKWEAELKADKLEANFLIGNAGVIYEYLGLKYQTTHIKDKFENFFIKVEFFGNDYCALLHGTVVHWLKLSNLLIYLFDSKAVQSNLRIQTYDHCEYNNCSQSLNTNWTNSSLVL